jgi:hypothetical protein
MRDWAKYVFVITFLIMCTLPFDPLLNQRFLVFPLTILCVTLGLIAMYSCTLPKPPAPTSGRLIK